MYNSFKQEISEAIKELAIGEKDVRSRLQKASYHLFKLELDKNNFPKEIQDDFNSIIQDLTKKEPIYLANGTMLFNSVENTMRQMKNSTGSKIANKILNLYIKLQS